MKKVLYFEGAGCVPAGEVTNCYIRTAFTNDNGKKIYIEILSYTVTNIDHEKWKRYSEYEVDTILGFCDSCHYITENPSVDDCNKSCLPCARKCNGQFIYTYKGIKNFINKNCNQFIYTYEGIKNFINENCNASFDEIVVLDNLAGYRVFNNNGKKNTQEMYNYGDAFAYDEELTEKCISKVAELSEHFKHIFNQKYDNTSYYIENGVLNVCLNVSEEVRKKAGYTNRRFTVEV